MRQRVERLHVIARTAEDLAVRRQRTFSAAVVMAWLFGVLCGLALGALSLWVGMA